MLLILRPSSQFKLLLSFPIYAASLISIFENWSTFVNPWVSSKQMRWLAFWKCSANAEEQIQLCWMLAHVPLSWLESNVPSHQCKICRMSREFIDSLVLLGLTGSLTKLRNFWIVLEGEKVVFICFLLRILTILSIVPCIQGKKNFWDIFNFSRFWFLVQSDFDSLYNLSLYERSY